VTPGLLSKGTIARSFARQQNPTSKRATFGGAM
jgi:hypothetical protein